MKLNIQQQLIVTHQLHIVDNHPHFSIITHNLYHILDVKIQHVIFLRTTMIIMPSIHICMKVINNV